VVAILACPVTALVWAAHLDSTLGHLDVQDLQSILQQMQQPQLFMVGGYCTERGQGPSEYQCCSTSVMGVSGEALERALGPWLTCITSCCLRIDLIQAVAVHSTSLLIWLVGTQLASLVTRQPACQPASHGLYRVAGTRNYQRPRQQA
jgi:hypothetical protein